MNTISSPAIDSLSHTVSHKTQLGREITLQCPTEDSRAHIAAWHGEKGCNRIYIQCLLKDLRLQHIATYRSTVSSKDRERR